MRNEEVGSQNSKAYLMVISGIGGDLIKLRLAIAVLSRRGITGTERNRSPGHPESLKHGTNLAPPPPVSPAFPDSVGRPITETWESLHPVLLLARD